MKKDYINMESETLEYLKQKRIETLKELRKNALVLGGLTATQIATLCDASLMYLNGSVEEKLTRFTIELGLGILVIPFFNEGIADKTFKSFDKYSRYDELYQRKLK